MKSEEALFMISQRKTLEKEQHFIQNIEILKFQGLQFRELSALELLNLIWTKPKIFSIE